MKYSASLAIAGAAVASAAAVPSEAPVDYCPVVVKTIGLSWIELDQFVPAHTMPLEDAESCVDKSEEQPSFVFPNLNLTAPDTDGLGSEDDYPSSGDGYPAGHLSESYSASVAAPYPTGLSNFTNNYPVPTGTGGVVPTGGLYTSKSASASASSATAVSYGAGRASSTSSAGPKPTSATCKNPRVRVEWSNMSDSQRDAFVAGIRCLMEKPSSNPSRFPGSRSLYEDLTSLHQQVASQVHQSGKFLVFHRFFVHIFEKMMREQCDFRGPLAWFDEAKYAGDFAKSDIFSPRWFGAIPTAINGRGVCVQESGFGSYEPNLGPGSAINNPHCLSRALDNGATMGCGQNYVDTCNRAKNYDAFRQCAEMTYHAYGHNAVGSVMSNVATSPEDPLFYCHHGWVDRNYRYWQNRGAMRIYEMGGDFSTTNPRQVTPSDTLPAFGLVPDVTIADVMNTENGFLCYKYDSE